MNVYSYGSIKYIFILILLKSSRNALDGVIISPVTVATEDTKWASVHCGNSQWFSANARKIKYIKK